MENMENIFISACVCIKYLWKDIQETEHLHFFQGGEEGHYRWREMGREFFKANNVAPFKF